jgi:uncharacterized protein
MKVNQVTFMSDGLKLAGEIYVPEDGISRYPAVCLCHGIPGSVYNPADRGWQALAEKFCKAGFVTMIFKFRGSGNSQGDFDLMGWTRDLKEAVDMLLKVPETDPGRLFLLGSSAGANMSIYLAANDNRIAGVVSLACPAEYSFINTDKGEPALREFRRLGIIRDPKFPPSAEEWLAGFARVAAVNWISRIAPRPILIMQGDRDDLVPVEHADRLFKLAGEPKELVLVPGAGHRLRLENSVIDKAIMWLQKEARIDSGTSKLV